MKNKDKIELLNYCEECLYYNICSRLEEFSSVQNTGISYHCSKKRTSEKEVLDEIRKSKM